MHTTMKKIFILLSFCFFSVGAWAQSNTTLSYSIGVPMGDLSDFITPISWRGINLDYRKMVTPNVGVGFTVGWNVFYEELPNDSYTVDNVTLSGKQWRYSNHIPMYLNPTYFFKPGESLNPFIGLGVGTMYSLRNTDMNLYTVEQDAWNFAVVPEVGFQYSVDDATAISVSGKLNYGFKAGNELDGNQSFFTLNVGFSFIN